MRIHIDLTGNETKINAPAEWLVKLGEARSRLRARTPRGSLGLVGGLNAEQKQVAREQKQEAWLSRWYKDALKKIQIVG